MQCTRTIGLIPAIMININIIIGCGIFINLSPLVQAGGAAGFLAYLAGAVLLLPIVIVLAALARRHPESGGLYVYAKNYLHPFIAFMCGWGYFAGKSISVGLIAHLFMQVMKNLFPVLTILPDFLLTSGLLACLVSANILGAAIQGRVQWILTAAKGLPVLFAGAVFFAHGSFEPIRFASLSTGTLNAMLPIAVFALVGFEVTCTLGHLFKDPDYTIMRALFYGFLAVVSLVTFFQMVVGTLIAPEQALVFPLAAIAHTYLPGFSGVVPFLYLCVYTSMLGGAFSILISNCWNLHRLAEQDHLPFSHHLVKVNRNQVPWVSLIVGAAISSLGIAITSNQGALQSMAILGMVFAYACAMLAALFARNDDGTYLVPPVIKVAALCSASFLMYLAFSKIALVGVSTPYLLLVASGVVCAIAKGHLTRD